MTNNFKAVTFDFDMTLADSSHAIHRCMNLMAKKLGLRELSYQTVLKGIGSPLEDSMLLYWGDFHKEWIDVYREEFRALERGAIVLFPNTIQALNKLRAAGVKCGVVSNRRYARSVIESVGLADLMDVIIGREDTERPKPNPDSLLKGLSTLGVETCEALYVGDTDIDMQTAVAANVRGVGVTTGNFDAEGLTRAGAWRVCNDLAEVPELLGIK